MKMKFVFAFLVLPGLLLALPQSRKPMVNSDGYSLDESAIHTVASSWRFKPAMTPDRTAVDVQANIEASFRLGGQPA